MILSFLHSRSALYLATVLLTLALPIEAKARDDKDPMLRIVCVSAIPGHDEYVMASRKKNGKWREHQSLNLRSSFISPWLPALRDELHLCIREDGNLVSTCSFTYPGGARRALLVLLPGEKESEYKAQMIDTSKPAFVKGEILIINSSTLPAEVKLGEKQVEAKPGEPSVHKPALDENGMFQMLVTYTNESGETVTCSDSYLPGNDTGRDLLILVPDPQVGLRVTNLAEFGPFE